MFAVELHQGSLKLPINNRLHDEGFGGFASSLGFCSEDQPPQTASLLRKMSRSGRRKTLGRSFSARAVNRCLSRLATAWWAPLRDLPLPIGVPSCRAESTKHSHRIHGNCAGTIDQRIGSHMSQESFGKTRRKHDGFDLQNRT